MLIDKNWKNDIKEDDNTSSDVRHRARITAQQEECIQELKNLQESFKESSRNENKSFTVKEEQEEVRPAEKQQEKEVNVSQKKNLFHIITEKLSCVVQLDTWKGIISGLKVLLLTPGLDKELLISEIKNRNRRIQSLLSLLKNSEKISFQLRIFSILKHLTLTANAPLEALRRVERMQKDVVSKLTAIAKTDTSITQTQELQKVISLNSQSLQQSRFLNAQVAKVEVSHSLNLESGISRTQCFLPQENYRIRFDDQLLQVGDAKPFNIMSSLSSFAGNTLRTIKDTLKNIADGILSKAVITSPAYVPRAHNRGESYTSHEDRITSRRENRRTEFYHLSSITERKVAPTVLQKHTHGNGCACCKNKDVGNYQDKNASGPSVSFVYTITTSSLEIRSGVMDVSISKTTVAAAMIR